MCGKRGYTVNNFLFSVLCLILFFKNSATIENDASIHEMNHILINNTNMSMSDISNDLSSNISYSEKFNLVDWLGQLFGHKPTEKPEPISDPPDCDKTCRCGLTNTRRRIVGGKETKVNQYPWMAALLYNNYFYCGGSLINDLYVLTAAHCVHGFRKDNIAVVLLEHDRSKKNETMTIKIRAKHIYVHESYNRNNYDHDIALIKLNYRLKMNGLIRPVCLAKPVNSYAGTNGTVTGWGSTSFGGEQSDVLNEVSVLIISNKECKAMGYGQRRITANMMCAGYPEGKKDSCQGDSGGPLHVEEDYVHRVVGVVSWGEGCAKPNYPGVYSRVNRYLSWIESKTKDACYCSAEVKKSLIEA